jgi:hypothetical protein
MGGKNQQARLASLIKNKKKRKVQKLQMIFSLLRYSV